LLSSTACAQPIHHTQQKLSRPGSWQGTAVALRTFQSGTIIFEAVTVEQLLASPASSSTSLLALSIVTNNGSLRPPLWQWQRLLAEWRMGNWPAEWEW
jgi:hypothetical protein